MHIRASYSLATLLLAALAAGCGVSKDKFRLSGKFKHLHSADIYIFSEEGRDTIRIEGGRFVYEKKTDRPVILTIQYPNFAELKIVAEPGKETRFTADASDLTQTRLSGTEENELLSDFYYATGNKSEKEAKTAAAKFINGNPATLAAEAVFRTYFANDKNADARLSLKLLDVILKNQPHNVSLSNLAGRLRPYLQTAPGNKMPGFEAVSWKGDTISDKDFKGRYLLMYFWASWQYESFQQARGLKKLVSPYRDRIGVVCVNMDYNYNSFLNTIRRDSLPEYNICEKKAWSSSLARLAGLTHLPGNLLVSPEGKIIARDLELADLRRRVSSLMEQK